MVGKGRDYTTYEINSNNRLGLRLREIIDYWELIYFFAWRDIKVKYKQTLLGFAWAIIQPLVMMTIVTVFVKGGFQINSGGISYPVFSFSGFLLWTLFSAGFGNAGLSMVNNANIIGKVYFPRIIIPLSSLVVNVLDFLIGFVAFIFLLIFLQQSVDPLEALLYWPLSILIALLSVVGPGCLIASLNVKYRDFRHATPFIIQMLLFSSPVIYSTYSLENPWIKYGLALNPMSAALTLFRAPLTTTTVDWSLIGLSVLSCLVLLWWGVTYFRRTEVYFADLA